jgi:hypothetical protein
MLYSYPEVIYYNSLINKKNMDKVLETIRNSITHRYCVCVSSGSICQKFKEINRGSFRYTTALHTMRFQNTSLLCAQGENHSKSVTH